MITAARLVRFPAAVAVLLFAFLAAAPASAQTGTISGTVTDSVTGDPLAWVLVKASEPGSWWGHIDLTNSSGFYEIDDLLPGTYVVETFTFDYEPAEMEVEVLDGETTTVDFALSPPAAGAASGTVTDADTGEPIADANVFLLGSFGFGFFSWPFHFTQTDDLGAYAFDDVDTGDYTLKVFRFGYEPSGPIAVAIADGETTVVDVALNPLAVGTLEGTVTDASTGDAIDGALVLALRMNGGFFGSGLRFDTTDATGFYQFENVNTGSWKVRAFAIGFFHGKLVVDVTEDATSVADFALEPK
ncbi:MAG: carboxypeptidase-like regulatory domain-containing protein [Planctomycetes bacterium]|nr:carboxypeptidase-like regulatory domain-containing protein [Planctomycetota bacterium]